MFCIHWLLGSCLLPGEQTVCFKMADKFNTVLDKSPTSLFTVSVAGNWNENKNMCKYTQYASFASKITAQCVSSAF